VGLASGWPHVHAFVAGTERLSVPQLQHAWRHGFTDVAVYDPALGAPYYITKQVTGPCEHYGIWGRLPPRRRTHARFT
jgi:hypothetical protein